MVISVIPVISVNRRTVFLGQIKWLKFDSSKLVAVCQHDPFGSKAYQNQNCIRRLGPAIYEN